MRALRTALKWLLPVAAALAVLNLINNTVGVEVLPSLIGDHDWMPDQGSGAARAFTIATTAATGVFAVAYGLVDARIKRQATPVPQSGRHNQPRA